MVFQHFSLFDNLTVAENVSLALDEPEPLESVVGRLAEVSRAYGLPARARAGGLAAVGRRAPAYRDRALPDAGPRAPRPRRAHLRAHPAGMRGPVRHPRAAARRGPRGALHLPQARGGPPHLRGRDRPAPRHGRRPHRSAQRDGREPRAHDGRRRRRGRPAASARAAHTPVRLAVRDLDLPSEDPHGTDLRAVSLEVCRGEILGVAGGGRQRPGGIVRRALGRAPRAPARGGPSRRRSDRSRGHQRAGAGAGAAFVPEERLGHAAAPRFSLSENALVAGHAANGFVRAGFVMRDRMLTWVDSVTGAFDVRKGPRDPEARALSGGNLQKFVVGREILRWPSDLVIIVLAAVPDGVNAVAARPSVRKASDRPRQIGSSGRRDQPDTRRAIEISRSSSPWSIYLTAGSRRPRPVEALTPASRLLAILGGADSPAERSAAGPRAEGGRLTLRIRARARAPTSPP